MTRLAAILLLLLCAHFAGAENLRLSWSGGSSPYQVQRSTDLRTWETWLITTNTQVWFAPSQKGFFRVPEARAWMERQFVEVRLWWDKSPDPSVKNYNLRWGCESGVWTNQLHLTNVSTSVVGGLRRDTDYFFVVVAEATNGICAKPSNVVAWRTPP